MWYITERKDQFEPAATDPKAQAMKRHSGMFDLRTADGGIVMSSHNLKYLRQVQARQNTATVLDYQQPLRYHQTDNIFNCGDK